MDIRSLCGTSKGQDRSAVASYWRENGYDLREYAQRNWDTRSQVAGKLHFFAGGHDDFT